ncbi:hypothetical protein Forpi1262_v011035 [Fusarium oxysporum f. sp. raphani]|uniref:Uncharacterized protein n=1 Tax=Fusarium oxysporum f. sp. raphani TaxID=96318 RepID=A0A8J5U3P0_FUSOX|nr:hypothetical protein Forpi1262_v011035 [Fusarium oxysporum f. sp. raphani]
MTTKDTIDRLWNAGLSSESNFDDIEDKKRYHEFRAGTFQNFECAHECIEVSFIRGNETVTRKTPPGHMRSVPEDITIVVHGGDKGGRARVWNDLISG